MIKSKRTAKVIAMPFDLASWGRAMDIVLGTKAKDPLVRYSERELGPVRECRFCSVSFTTLGMSRHVNACKENPATLQRRKLRVRA